MRSVEKIYEATTRSKLTVTPTTVTMRFRTGADDAERSRVESFFTKVAAKIAGVDRTVRGNLALHKETDTMYIVMQTEGSDYSGRFFEHEV